MKPRAKRLYAAESKETGLILRDGNDALLVDSNRAELLDRASDLHGKARKYGWQVVAFDRR